MIEWLPTGSTDVLYKRESVNYRKDGQQEAI